MRASPVAYAEYCVQAAKMALRRDERAQHTKKLAVASARLSMEASAAAAASASASSSSSTVSGAGSKPLVAGVSASAAAASAAASDEPGGAPSPASHVLLRANSDDGPGKSDHSGSSGSAQDRSESTAASSLVDQARLAAATLASDALAADLWDDSQARCLYHAGELIHQK